MLKILITCLLLSGKDPKTLHQRAHYYYTNAQYSKSIIYWEKLLKIQPENAFAVFMLGKSYIGKGEVAKGEELCDKAIEMN
jgi:tetratricopeptide (TPR) repeat protein